MEKTYTYLVAYVLHNTFSHDASSTIIKTDKLIERLADFSLLTNILHEQIPGRCSIEIKTEIKNLSDCIKKLKHHIALLKLSRSALLRLIARNARIGLR